MQILLSTHKGTAAPEKALRYAMVSAIYLVLSLGMAVLGRASFSEHPQVSLTPVVALAAILLIVCGGAYLPVAVLSILLESSLTPGLTSNFGLAVVDALLGTIVAGGAAFCVRRYSDGEKWGSQRDFLVLGGCIVFLPLLSAAIEFPLQTADDGSTSPVLLLWLATVVPLAALVPAGIKLAEWANDQEREPLDRYLGRGVQPSIQVLQVGVLALGAAFIWIEQVSGGTGRVYPLFLVVFWMAVTSGLPAAAVGFLLAEGLLVTVNLLTKTRLTFDLQLAATVMGSCALVAGSLVTARQASEERRAEQAETLRRQLAEMQVIRSLADSIIALRDESVLYELGAESIGVQLGADQTWLLWIPVASNAAEERGFWASSAETQRDSYSPDFRHPDLGPLWTELGESHASLFSLAGDSNETLTRTRLDVPLHQASGIKSLLLHPFSFGATGFYVAAILSYRRFLHWSVGDKQFVAAVADQITIALQKTQLLGERDERSRSFARMSQALVAETGETFFRNLVLRLSEAAGSRGAYASRVVPGRAEATMLALADSGRVRKEFQFSPRG
nr:hypothetical protein [Fimbriimonadaceae bacterium]